MKYVLPQRVKYLPKILSSLLNKRPIMFRSFLSGFTLIELLVVIGVVGALATAVMTVINPIEQIAKSRDSRRKSDLAEVQKALELYYHDHGEYPASDAESDQIISADGSVIEWGGSFTPYIELLPKDPDASARYAYESNGQSYRIFTSLERGDKDEAACKDIPCATASSVSCGSATCNYAVSSPNVSPDAP